MHEILTYHKTRTDAHRAENFFKQNRFSVKATNYEKSLKNFFPFVVVLLDKDQRCEAMTLANQSRGLVNALTGEELISTAWDDPRYDSPPDFKQRTTYRKLGNVIIKLLDLHVKSNGRVDLVDYGDKTPEGLGRTIARFVAEHTG